MATSTAGSFFYNAADGQRKKRNQDKADKYCRQIHKKNLLKQIGIVLKNEIYASAPTARLRTAFCLGVGRNNRYSIKRSIVNAAIVPPPKGAPVNSLPN